jgi:cytochrome P450
MISRAHIYLGRCMGVGWDDVGNLFAYTFATVLHPQWQKKVRDEVDRVVGDRLPNLDDLPDLPIVRAAVKETLRWRPVTAGGIPHKSVEG